MGQVKVEMVGREVIKPASPSPQDRHQLSVIDLNCPPIYVPAIFFYKAEDLINLSPEITTKNLKSSLSKTLSRFYPLAGRIDGASISCNDEGAIFDEARTDIFLPEFLTNLNPDSLIEFLPTRDPGHSAGEWPLLSVKVTYFASGSGVAVSIFVSHKICDAASLLTFSKDWANTTANGKSDDNAAVSTVHFAETTIFPTHISPVSSSNDSFFDTTSKCVVNRFVFDSSKIAELKHEASNEGGQLPTRVEAITSLIWRCARNASHSNLLVPRSTSMFQSVDLRPRLPSSVLPPDAIGNLGTGFILKESAESELEIHKTVAAFRKAKVRVNEMIDENLQKNTLGQSLLIEMENIGSEFNPDTNIYTFSSWCGKPFYEVNFGWGTPLWMGPTTQTITDNVCLLIDSKDGKGVEAWISLPKQDMPVFHHDQELLAYAVVNPPVFI